MLSEPCLRSNETIFLLPNNEYIIITPLNYYHKKKGGEMVRMSVEEVANFLISIKEN
jgi:hypothetical protein